MNRTEQRSVYWTMRSKLGVALTVRNTTGPPRATPGELRCAVECYRRRQTTDDDRRTASKTTLAPTLCVGGPVICQWFS